MSGAGPILAIDFGLRRCGIARSDPDRMIAFGLPTFETGRGRSLQEHLCDLHEETPVTGIVLGYPRHLDGRPADLAEPIMKLGDWVGTELDLPVAYWDERLTTVAVERHLMVAPKKVRENKRIKDRLAAQLILQGFLDAGCPFAAHAQPKDL